MKHVMSRDRHGKQYSVPVNVLRWRPSVYGIILRDETILLSRQWDGYDFPGGGIDLGEGIQEALMREIREETGFETTVGELVTCETSFFSFGTDDHLHSLLLYYLAEITGGKASIAGAAGPELDYIALPEWVPLSKIETVKFYNSVDSVNLIRRALKLKSIFREHQE